MKEQQPLSPADLQRLKKQLKPMIAFPFIVIIMFGTFGYFFFPEFGSDSFAGYAFGIFGLFFFGIIAYLILSTYTDIRRGVKNVITGTVTDKQMRISTSSGKGSSTSTKRYYTAYIDDKKYSVDGIDYGRIRVGQQIELHKAPKSDLTLALYIHSDVASSSVAESGKQPIPVTEETDRFLKTSFPAMELTAEDRATLKRMMWRQVRIKGLWMLPFAYIIFALITSGYWGILIFLFPVVIIPGVMLYFLGKRIKEYFDNIQYNQKTGTPAVVEDKSSITSNRSGDRNHIKTSTGSLTVPKSLYDLLQPGQRIIVFRPKYGKDALSIMTLDQQEHPLR